MVVFLQVPLVRLIFIGGNVHWGGPLRFLMIVAATIFWLQFFHVFPLRTVVMNSCPAKPNKGRIGNDSGRRAYGA